MRDEAYFKRILRVLEEFTDEEIVANSSKIVRLVLRDDHYFERVVAQYKSLGDFLMQLMEKHFSSLAIILETISALRNFTRNPRFIKYINPAETNVLVSICREPKYDKAKVITLQCIKNIMVSPDHESYLRQRGAKDVLMMAKMQANLAGSVNAGQMGLNLNDSPRRR